MTNQLPIYLLPTKHINNMKKSTTHILMTLLLLMIWQGDLMAQANFGGRTPNAVNLSVFGGIPNNSDNDTWAFIKAFIN
jgi:hypothetical protein